MRLLPPQITQRCCHGRLILRIQSLTLKCKSTESNVVRLQWWGEESSCVIKSAGIEYAVDEEQLKSYLQLCQVLEFMVGLEGNDDVIGSSFLTNLTDILKKSNFALPVVDHSGTKIGEMKLIFTISGTLLSNIRQVTTKAIHKNVYASKDSCEKKTVAHKGKYYGIAAALAKVNSNNPVKFPYKGNEIRKTNFQAISLPSSPKARRQDYGIAAALNKIKECSSVRFPYKRKHVPVALAVSSPVRIARKEPQSVGDIPKIATPGEKSYSNFTNSKSQVSASSGVLYKEPCVIGRDEEVHNLAQTYEKVSFARELSNLKYPQSSRSLKNDFALRSKDGETHVQTAGLLNSNTINAKAKKINSSVAASKFSALPKVLDYLLGKEMSEHEERVALKYLHEVSPEAKLVTAVTECCERLVQSPEKSVLYSPKRLQERVFKLPLNKDNTLVSSSQVNSKKRKDVVNCFYNKGMPQNNKLKRSSNVEAAGIFVRKTKNYNVSHGNPKEFMAFSSNVCSKYDLNNPVEKAYCKQFLLHEAS